MILYDNVCTPCVRRQQWRELRRFAVKHKLTVKRVDVRGNKESLEEARQYGIDLPFVVHDKVALSLSEPLERLL